jgi:hypothetical protein
MMSATAGRSPAKGAVIASALEVRRAASAAPQIILEVLLMTLDPTV